MSDLDARSAQTAETRERVGTIGDVMRRYGVDAGEAWRIIAHAAPIINPTSRKRVRLVANPDEREGTTWIVYEEPS